MFENREHSALSNDELLGRTWFKLIKIEIVDYKSDYWSFQREYIKNHLLIISASEQNRVVIDGHNVPTYPGMVLSCRPGQLVEAGVSSEVGEALYLLHYERGNLEQKAEDGPTQEQQLLSLWDGECEVAASTALCEHIHRCWGSTNPVERMRAQAAFHELLALLIELSGQEAAQSLEGVKAEIDRHYSEDISIERLVTLSGISRYHLMRVFRERYGKSIVEYITEKRLHHAKQLMLERNHSIREIAEMVGFQSEPYFRTVFKKQVGIAPAAYIRNRQRKVAAYSWPVLGQLLPLQTVPYAAPLDHYWTNDFSRKYGSDVVVPLGHDYEFNRSALRLAKPDFIIGLNSTISPEEEQLLSEIAPVLLLPWMEVDWRQHLQMVADFLSRGDEADQWLESYDRKADSTREHIQGIIKADKVLVLKISGDRLFIWGRKAMTVLYDDLQLKPSSLVDGIEWFEPITIEQLSFCDAGTLFFSVNGDASSQKLWRFIQSSKQWGNLDAVRRGKVYQLEGHPSWVFPWVENTALNHERSLDELKHLLLCDN